MFDETLADQIKVLETRLLDLKTAKKAGPAVKMRMFSPENYPFYTGLHKLTYESGNVPIITQGYGNLALTFFTPEDNIQYVYVQNQGIGYAFFLSTRTIKNIEFVW